MQSPTRWFHLMVDDSDRNDIIITAVDTGRNADKDIHRNYGFDGPQCMTDNDDSW